MLSRRLTWVACLAAVAALLLGVAPADARGVPSPSSALWQAQVRVAHFSPDAPNVDVYVNGRKLLSGVPFKAVSDYVSLRPGLYKFDIRAAGAPANSKPVLSARLVPLPGRAYTVAAVGQVASIKAKVYHDAVCAPDAGKAKVRAIHAAPDVPAVDVAVQNGGPVLIAGLTFPNASKYLEIPAGSYPLEIRLAGTPTSLLKITAPVEAGNIYTIAAVGLAGAGTATLLPVVDAKDVKDPARGPRAAICRA